ncbi:MAG: DUF4416 family protein [Methanobacteriota archaeon]
MKAKLFAAIMYSGEEAYKKAIEELVKKFGAIDGESEVFAFDFTDYYAEEMGQKLFKKFLSFREPIKQEELADIKLFTNELEKKFSVEGKRQVNIDPGYVTALNLVLATKKESQHRIYLRDGVFAEATLAFKKNGCIYFDWTYPDYKTKLACEFLLKVRGKLMKAVQ